MPSLDHRRCRAARNKGGIAAGVLRRMVRCRAHRPAGRESRRKPMPAGRGRASRGRGTSVRPVRRRRGMSVLDRVEWNIVDMRRIIGIAKNRMLPKAALPSSIVDDPRRSPSKCAAYRTPSRAALKRCSWDIAPAWDGRPFGRRPYCLMRRDGRPECRPASSRADEQRMPVVYVLFSWYECRIERPKSDPHLEARGSPF